MSTGCTGTTTSCTTPANNGQTCGGQAYIPASVGPGKANFIGFGAISGTGCATLAIQDHYLQDVAATTDTDCGLSVTSYKLGVFGHVGGDDYTGFQIDNVGVVGDRATLQANGFGNTCI